MFDLFPKTRPVVDEKKLQRLYENYEQNRLRKTAASRLAGWAESWMHKRVAADVLDKKNCSTLEIGAGSLNHLAYGKTTAYDIIEPWEKLVSQSSQLLHIRNKYADITELPLDAYYDRIISIATFEHLLNLPQVVAHSCFHLTLDGCMRVAIPNEGSFIWTICWRLTTGLEYFLKTGQDYGLIMKYEHINTADEIEEVLNYFFEDVKKSLMGVNDTLAIYRFYECRKPQQERALTFINKV